VLLMPSGVPNCIAMRLFLRLLFVLLSIVVSLGAAVAAVAAEPAAAIEALALQDDEAVPPGNPVVGSDERGDIEDTSTNYGPWILVAVCLIGAGVLLVKIERWEARRVDAAER